MKKNGMGRACRTCEREREREQRFIQDFGGIKKVKHSGNKSWRIRSGIEYWASILTLIFGTT
jgi:hypothetical protein